jgi:hypothetical protein
MHEACPCQYDGDGDEADEADESNGSQDLLPVNHIKRLDHCAFSTRCAGQVRKPTAALPQR